MVKVEDLMDSSSDVPNDSTNSNGHVGTLLYAAPEGGNGIKGDMYSLGTTLTPND